jgi:hypothetical protein
MPELLSVAREQAIPGTHVEKGTQAEGKAYTDRLRLNK